MAIIAKFNLKMALRQLSKKTLWVNLIKKFNINKIADATANKAGREKEISSNESGKKNQRIPYVLFPISPFMPTLKFLIGMRNLVVV